MRTRPAVRPRLEAMETRTLLSVTSPHPGVTALEQLHGPRAILPMDKVNLFGFEAMDSAKLNKRHLFVGIPRLFTVDISLGVVTKGLASATEKIAVTGQLKFTIAKDATASSKLTDLKELYSGSLSIIQPNPMGEIELKLTLPARTSPAAGNFDYKVTKATGAYEGTTGTGLLAFSALFPSDDLGTNSGNCVAIQE